MLRTTVRIFNAAAASWEKNPKLGFGGAATQIPTPIIRQYDGDGDYFDDDDDDYIHIMMECALVCLWVMKNDNCLKRGGSVRLWVMKNDHFLKKVSWPTQECQKMTLFLKNSDLKKVSRIPMWVTKNEHFHNMTS